MVDSEPAGATVFLDDVERGRTPLVIRNVEAGRHKIALQLAGYEDFLRQVHVPDVLPRKPYKLVQKPATLLITSNPPGATVAHGSQILGQTPLMLTQFLPGQYEFRITAPGYEAQKKTGAVSDVRGEVLHADLASLLGSLELTTVPLGCRVLIDGVVKGTTAALDDKTRQSKPLRIEGLMEGTHQVRIEHPYGPAKSGRIKVVRGETAKLFVRLWVLDTKATLKDGKVRHGMLVEKNAYGDIVLEEAPNRLERYLGPQVAEVLSLTQEQAQAAAKELRLPDPAGRTGTLDAGPDAKPETRPAPPAHGAGPNGR